MVYVQGQPTVNPINYTSCLLTILTVTASSFNTYTGFPTAIFVLPHLDRQNARAIFVCKFETIHSGYVFKVKNAAVPEKAETVSVYLLQKTRS